MCNSFGNNNDIEMQRIEQLNDYTNQDSYDDEDGTMHDNEVWEEVE